jgi:hypothetical protein
LACRDCHRSRKIFFYSFLDSFASAPIRFGFSRIEFFLPPPVSSFFFHGDFLLSPGSAKLICFLFPTEFTLCRFWIFSRCAGFLLAREIWPEIRLPPGPPFFPTEPSLGPSLSRRILLRPVRSGFVPPLPGLISRWFFRVGFLCLRFSLSLDVFGSRGQPPAWFAPARSLLAPFSRCCSSSPASKPRGKSTGQGSRAVAAKAESFPLRFSLRFSLPQEAVASVSVAQPVRFCSVLRVSDCVREFPGAACVHSCRWSPVRFSPPALVGIVIQGLVRFFLRVVF